MNIINMYQAVIARKRVGGGDTGLLSSLDCSQDNGNPLTFPTDVNVTAANITHGTGWDSVANASVVFATTGTYNYPCTDTNGLINSTQGTTVFWFKNNLDIASAYIFAQSSSTSAFTLFRDVLTDKLNYRINGSSVNFILTTDIWDGSWHKIMVTHDHAASERKIYIGDDTSVTLEDTNTDAWTDTDITTGSMWIGSRSGLFYLNGEIQDFQLYDSVYTSAP